MGLLSSFEATALKKTWPPLAIVGKEVRESPKEVFWATSEGPDKRICVSFVNKGLSPCQVALMRWTMYGAATPACQRSGLEPLGRR